MSEYRLKPGWTRVKFGDVVRQVKDKVDVEASGLERYIAGEHMDTDDLRIRRWGTIDDGYLGPAFHMRFKPGQVLYGSRRTYLRKVAVPDFEGICANTTFVLESRDPTILLPELLPFIMQTESFHEHSIKQSKGSVNPYINFSDLEWYEFALPSIYEQWNLSTALTASIDTVEAYRAAFYTAKIYLESIREHLFVEPHTRKVPLFQALASIEAGKSLIGVDKPPSTGEYAVLKVSAVGRDGFLPEESKTLVDQQSFLTEYAVKAGDLLVTRANTPDLVGMVCLVEKDYPNLMLSDKTLRLIPKAGIAPKLLREALWTTPVRQQLKSIATGTGAAMKNISQEKLRNLLVPLPSDTSLDSNVLTQMVKAQNAVYAVEQRKLNAQAMHHTLITELIKGCA